MTVYLGPKPIDIVGARIVDGEESQKEAWKLWFAYRDVDADRHRGINEAYLGEIRADEGKDEIISALSELPNARIRGNDRLAMKARGEYEADPE